MPFGYIDPGSGSMLIQVLLAGALAIPFFFRRVIADGWHRIRGGDRPSDPVKGGEDSDSRP
jgi:hypothetical protein